MPCADGLPPRRRALRRPRLSRPERSGRHGNAPTSGWLIRLLRETIARGVIVLNITECGGGRVSMELYETGLRLQETGVLCGCDMTSEAAVTKLMYVLGLELPREETERLLRRPLRGEFTD